MKQLLARWLPPLAWMGLIYALSAQPDLPMPPGPWLENLLDKAAHAVTYSILSLLLLRALRLRYRISSALLLAVLALTVTYGATDEYHQSFVPGRSASLVDLAADGVGAATAMAVAWLRRRRREGRRLAQARS